MAKLIALGSPAELISSLGGEHVIEFSLGNGAANDPPRLDDLPAVRSSREDSGAYCLSVTEPHVTLPALLDRLEDQGREFTSLTTRTRSLEDVFVKLTGRRLQDDEEARS